MNYQRAVNRLSLIEPYIKGKNVLDIGCVDARPGSIRKYDTTGLHKFVKRHANSLLGVDIDAEGVKEMQGKGYNVVCANAENISLDQTFDCIVAGEIIEHVNNAGLFLTAMGKHLNDDGVLIVTTPNAACISNFFRVLKRNTIKVHPDHTCWYDPITITQLIHRFPLKVEKIVFTNKEKWYRKRYFYKIFRYQIPKLITWLRPYFSGTIVVIIKRAD